MNIEQIADAVSKEMLMHVATLQPELVKWNREFLLRCLSKLAEQDVEHVGEVTHRAFGYVKWASERPEIGTKLYTEAQLLAAQQRTAEACAKLLHIKHESCKKAHNYYLCAAVEIEQGGWREYL